jgi:integrase
MRGLFRWALDAGHVAIDPTAGVKNPKRKKTEGLRPIDEVATYIEKWSLGMRQYVWLHVSRYTGVRLATRSCLANSTLEMASLHSSQRRAAIGDLSKLHDGLSRSYGGAGGRTVRRSGFHLRRTRPSSHVREFRKRLQKACVAAGILGKSEHGLRKLSATIWAERRATEHEFMAMLGRRTPQMAALYTRAAHRKKLALSAHDRLSRSSNYRTDEAQL